MHLINVLFLISFGLFGENKSMSFKKTFVVLSSEGSIKNIVTLSNTTKIENSATIPTITPLVHSEVTNSQSNTTIEHGNDTIQSNTTFDHVSSNRKINTTTLSSEGSHQNTTFNKEQALASMKRDAGMSKETNSSASISSTVRKRKISSRIVKTCGVPSIRTTLDSNAEFGEWPWHVAIVEAKDDLYICGGSLISDRRILTAAHCLQKYLKSKKVGSPRPHLKIRAGEWNVSTNMESLPHVEALVQKIFIHPNFDSETLQNDIAVIQLGRSIVPVFRSNIAPVCLPQKSDSSDNLTNRKMSSLKRCVVTGWGRFSENSQHSIILKEIVIPMWKRERCEAQLRNYFGSSFSLPNSTLCGGDEENDACDGDGGGPLVCYENGHWIQEGIVSYGIGCKRANSPGIYTRVSSYLSFLNVHMGNDINPN